MNKKIILVYSCLLTLSFICCNVSENMFKNKGSNIRSDGLYIAVNPHRHSYIILKGGKQEECDAIDILRFFTLDSGIIINHSIAKKFSYDPKEIKKIFSKFDEIWKEHHDKSPIQNIKFEMFNPKIYSIDSIKFTQKYLPEGIDTLKTSYIGKIYEDSLSLNFVFQLEEGTPLPPCHQTFKFYPVEE